MIQIFTIRKKHKLNDLLIKDQLTLEVTSSSNCSSVQPYCFMFGEEVNVVTLYRARRVHPRKVVGNLGGDYSASISAS